MFYFLGPIVLIACSTFLILLGMGCDVLHPENIFWAPVFIFIVLPQVVLAILAIAFFKRDSVLRGRWQRSPAATPFLFSYFCVVLGCGQRYFFSVYGDDLGERLVNLEWATNTQNTLCFTAVVCALHVLYNQRAIASSAEAA